MSRRCPWHGYAMHRYSEKSDCYIQHMYDDSFMHIFKNILYSMDPKTGKPLTKVLVGVDDVKMMEFGLNNRVCNVESVVNANEVHILEFQPTNATELWTLMRNVYTKWERLYEENGHMYWPCKSQAADLVINGDIDSLRCLQPIRYVTERYKLACSLLDLLLILTSNYFKRLLKFHMSGEYLLEVSRQKVRKIECNASNKALSYFRSFDPDKYDRAEKNPNAYAYSCSVKTLMDSLSKGESHKFPTNFLRKLFHFTIADVFTGHRDHVHMLLCNRFLVEDSEHCESWIQLMLAVADSRLQSEDAQNRLITEVKQWKKRYEADDRAKRRESERSTKRCCFEDLRVSDERSHTDEHSDRGYNRAANTNSADCRQKRIYTINRDELEGVGSTGTLHVRGTAGHDRLD